MESYPQSNMYHEAFRGKTWQKPSLLNLKMDDRPIEYKPSTKLLGVHIDDTLTWDNEIKHISSKVSNGLRTLYFKRLKTIFYSLGMYNPTAPKYVLTNCKSCKIEQHGFLLGLITPSDHQMH